MGQPDLWNCHDLVRGARVRMVGIAGSESIKFSDGSQSFIEHVLEKRFNLFV